MITKQEIEEAKKLCEEATTDSHKDAKFIAASHTLVPKLIEAVEKLTEGLEEIAEETVTQEEDHAPHYFYSVATEGAELAADYLNIVWKEEK